MSKPQDDNAFWFPSSVGRHKDGSTAVFPHIWDRAKPGIVAVNADGRRFVDESVPYHRFTRAMYRSNGSTPTVPAWLVIDSRALSCYGLGMIRPKLPQLLLRKYLTSGYLHCATSIRELATTNGVDPDGLTRTFGARGRNAVVVPLQVAADDLDALVRGLGPSGSVAGIIATMPHKFGLARHCGTLTDRARFLGSVNVARRNPDGSWHGDQVDGAAYVAAIRASGGDPARRRVLQVGAGGARSAIALALLEAGGGRVGPA